MSCPRSLITWNVNSVRARLDQVLTLIEEYEPDVLCIQETKVTDQLFPKVPFMEYGYRCSIHGTKGYAGVATFSKVAPQGVQMGFREEPPDRAPRILEVGLGDWRVVNVYCPNGTALDSDAFPYKLEWFRRLAAQLKDSGDVEHLLVCGDFNVAPDDRDVWDAQAMRDCLHVTAEERQALGELIEIGLVDGFRLRSEAAGMYTWFDYRGGGFQRGHGLRIDHVYLGAAWRERLIDVVHLDQVRGWDTPSDHVPVLATFQGD